MKTYLVIEAVNVVGFIGNVAYLEVITHNDNILKFEKRDPTIRSISAFKTMKAANEQINFLNGLYRKERKQNENIELYNKVESATPKSAWRKGVQEQALEMVEQAEVKLTKDNAKEVLLNGADNWSEYSYSGNALIYDVDIAERYCTPSELKRNDNGNKKPNANEEWMDLQARALSQAYLIIKRNIR